MREGFEPLTQQKRTRSSESNEFKSGRELYMKKTICLLLVLLMALTMVGCGETTLGAETGDIVDETEQATPTDAAIPEQTFTPERENPMILYSSADEYDFRMELYDANWTYERPSQEGQSYVITNASFHPDHALILTGRMDFDGDDMTADELDEVNDYLLESIYSDSNGTIHVLERTEYPVGNCRGRALLGRIAWDDIADCCVDTYIITWVKKESASNRLFIYYLIATADPPAFDATVSEANLMLLSFQTTDEYSRNGEAELPEGVVRGCAYDIPYSNAVCLENEDGSHSVQVIIQIRNTGTIPIWVAGSSSFEVKDSEEKLVCSCPSRCQARIFFCPENHRLPFTGA